MSENTQLVLIGGKSATGKSASLMGLRDPERVAYMNCENWLLVLIKPIEMLETL